MSSSFVNRQIAKLKSQFETRLNWGESSAWSNYDFERLSEQIAEKSGVSLSVSTLKRIFGKVDYKSEPSVTTLNALAQFLDYTDWRDFAAQNADDTGPNELRAKEVSTPFVAAPKTNRPAWIGGLLLVLSVGIFSFYFLAGKSKVEPAQFHFSSKTVLTEGLPNSVVFDFDASKADEQDSVFISQTWDIRRKVLIHKNAKHYSTIYYYPGFYRAKLMVGNEVVREHDIQIKTNGWLGLVEADWGIEPLYFKQAEILKSGIVEVNKAMLNKYNLPLNPTPPKVLFFNQKDSRGILTDNFTFETELKNEYEGGANACQRVEVLVQAKNDILIVPLVKKGCVGDVYLAAYGHYASSYEGDLSGFGCNPAEWTRLKVTCKNGLMKFYINNKQVYTTPLVNKPTEIVGVQCRFNGMGAVRNT